MKEVKGDIFATHDLNNPQRTIYICITTNGSLRINGEAVMGAGIARQAAEISPKLPKVLGKSIWQRGNHVVFIHPDVGFWVVFPVKQNWEEKADLKLIERSCIELASLARNELTSLFLLPRPGCGNGRLDWAEVRQVCKLHFDSAPNIWIVDIADDGQSANGKPQGLEP